jgi:hypothetical protein
MIRLSRGQGRSGNEDGKIHDFPDFIFADGTPPPITPTQLKWLRKRLKEKERIQRLIKEMTIDIKKDNWQQFF